MTTKEVYAGQRCNRCGSANVFAKVTARGKVRGGYCLTCTRPQIIRRHYIRVKP